MDDDVVYVWKRGRALLCDPSLNKGTAFSAEEREAFGLVGLLPDHVSTLEEELVRAHARYLAEPPGIARHIHLRALQDRDETLYYALIEAHLEEMLPVVYTPLVAEACRSFSHIHQRPRGLFVTPGNIDAIGQMLHALPDREAIELIVATDNQRILGIGDQGVGGMGIPIGKTSLYVAAAGIPPARTLPVTIDVGTDNEALLGDPQYLGVRRPRISREAHYSLLERFASAVSRALPRAVLQWEDLGRATAFWALERFRRHLPSFNDDIQGTGAMCLAGLIAAERVTGIPLADASLVIVGGGEAGIGLAMQATALLGRQWKKEKLFVLDSQGLLVSGVCGSPEKEAFAVEPSRLGQYRPEGRRPQLIDVVRAARPTALVLATGIGGLLGEDVVREMAKYVERPVIFPLSNPTTHAEARPEDIYRWTEGRAIVATGSPFPDYGMPDGRILSTAQANNVLVFPGMGLGTLFANAREVTDGMFAAATHALASLTTSEELSQGRVFPSVRRLREIAHAVAVAVARRAYVEGVARAPMPEDDDIEGKVRARMWRPRYQRYVPAP